MFIGNGLFLWVVVIILSVVIEASTLGLCGIWFAVGGLAALLAASIGLAPTAQLVIFVLFSGALLLLVRPFCKRFLSAKPEATNADRLIGQTATVTEQIEGAANTGQVRLSGQLWTARSTDGAVIPIGATVRVTQIVGVKVMVKQES
jgi:membrane protein implicated in regulation of membrane protease activity